MRLHWLYSKCNSGTGQATSVPKVSTVWVLIRIRDFGLEYWIPQFTLCATLKEWSYTRVKIYSRQLWERYSNSSENRLSLARIWTRDPLVASSRVNYWAMTVWLIGQYCSFDSLVKRQFGTLNLALGPGQVTVFFKNKQIIFCSHSFWNSFPEFAKCLSELINAIVPWLMTCKWQVKL